MQASHGQAGGATQPQQLTQGALFEKLAQAAANNPNPQQVGKLP